jgi:hypothetical protein
MRKTSNNGTVWNCQEKRDSRIGIGFIKRQTSSSQVQIWKPSHVVAVVIHIPEGEGRQRKTDWMRSCCINVKSVLACLFCLLLANNKTFLVFLLHNRAIIDRVKVSQTIAKLLKKRWKWGTPLWWPWMVVNGWNTHGTIKPLFPFFISI